MMGLVNHMSTYISQLWPEYDKWVISLGSIRKGYHGGTYEGNTCRIILSKCDELETLLPFHLKPLLQPLRSFNKLVHATFGNYLDPDYLSVIADFKDSYMKAQEYCTEVSTVIYLPSF